MLNSPIGLFRFFGFIEGASLIILLFIAMPLKYLVDFPIAVTIVGSLHGLFFVLYILIAFYTTYKVRWALKWLAGAMIVAFIPFGNMILDSQLQKAGFTNKIKSVA